jgi:FkbM family methyltransferase
MSTNRPSYLGLKRSFGALTGRDIWQKVQVKCDMALMGNEGARWAIHPTELSGKSVVYSFGVGEDISFDLELIQRFGVTVHAFDPTPRTVRWMRTRPVPEKFIFHEYGIADFDGLSRFFPPENPLHVSHTMVHRKAAATGIDVPVYRLTTIMNMLGHASIDVMKMDIEGAEYPVLRDLLASPLCIHQLLIEFHHRWAEIGLDQTRKAIRELNRSGYRIFAISSKGEEYGFLLEASAGRVRKRRSGM